GGERAVRDQQRTVRTGNAAAVRPGRDDCKAVPQKRAGVHSQRPGAVPDTAARAAGQEADVVRKLAAGHDCSCAVSCETAAEPGAVARKGAVRYGDGAAVNAAAESGGIVLKSARGDCERGVGGGVDRAAVPGHVVAGEATAGHRQEGPLRTEDSAALLR